MSYLKEITIFLEYLGDAIIIVNESSELVFANTACRKLFGYDTHEMSHMRIESLMFQPDSVDHQSKVKNFIQSHQPAKTMMTRSTKPCVDANGKTFNARISIASVEIDCTLYGMATIQDFTDFQKEMSHLETASHQDALTGLFNRRYLENITDLNSRVLAKWSNIGVIYIDLNKFKPINDTYGHDAGDLVLKVVANRIRNCIRFDDIAFRLGGDEFVVLLNLSKEHGDNISLGRIAEKIETAVNKPIETEQAKLRVSLSAGCGLYPVNETDLMNLVNMSDKAMYSARKDGRSIAFVQDTATET